MASMDLVGSSRAPISLTSGGLRRDGVTGGVNSGLVSSKVEFESKFGVDGTEGFTDGSGCDTSFWASAIKEAKN